MIVVALIAAFVAGWLAHDLLGPLRSIKDMHDKALVMLDESRVLLDDCKALREEHEALYGGGD